MIWIHVTILSVYFFNIGNSIYRRIYLPPGVIPHYLVSNGWMFKYFTYWTQFVHIFTFTVTLICDLKPKTQRNASYFRLRDALFNRLALPMAFFVATSYWFVYAYDQKLVDSLPSGLRQTWKNQVLHTFPIFVVLFDTFLIDHKRRRDINGHKTLWAVIIAFSTYLTIIGYLRNDWVYPILAKVNSLIRLIILLFVLGLETFFYHLGGRLYNLAW